MSKKNKSQNSQNGTDYMGKSKSKKNTATNDCMNKTDNCTNCGDNCMKDTKDCK